MSKRRTKPKIFKKIRKKLKLIFFNFFHFFALFGQFPLCFGFSKILKNFKSSFDIPSTGSLQTRFSAGHGLCRKLSLTDRVTAWLGVCTACSLPRGLKIAGWKGNGCGTPSQAENESSGDHVRHTVSSRTEVKNRPCHVQIESGRDSVRQKVVLVGMLWGKIFKKFCRFSKFSRN